MNSEISNKQKLILIDGNAILHRAYHALPTMSLKDGTLVNAVFGFTSFLLKLLNELNPNAIAVAFDIKGKTFRDEIYADYKAGRVKHPQELYSQIELIKNVLSSMDIPWIEMKGYEADDIIGSISKQVVKEHDDWDVVIATGDMDELQLVDKNIRVYGLKHGIAKVKMYDEDVVRGEYGLNPEQLIDYKAFRGDPSDNIKGVKGIGEKTALALIKNFETVEGVYDALEKTNEIKEISKSQIQKIVDGKKDALLSKKLVTILTHLKTGFSLKDAKISEFDNNKIEEQFRKFEFISLLNRVPGFNGASANIKKKDLLKDVVVISLSDSQAWSDFVKKISKAKRVSMFCGRAKQASMFDSGGLNVGCAFDDCVFSISTDASRLEQLVEMMICGNFEVIGFDVKQLFHDLKVKDANMIKYNDVMLLEYVLHAGRESDLEKMMFEYAKISVSEKIKSDISRYVAFVAKGIFAIEPILLKEIKKQKQEKVIKDIELPLLKVLYEMEQTGILLDKSVLDNLRVRVQKDIKKITSAIYSEAGQEFNISSPQQLKEVLFDKLRLPYKGIKKGKTGYSTAASELNKMRGLHPIIEQVFEYRELTKLLTTYIDALPKLILEDRRIHTTFTQAITATGRLASQNPNLQNIPARTELGREVRAAFVAERGSLFVAFDYSQFELRIAAHLSKDKVLSEIFRKREDVHTSTAAKIHDIPVENVTKDIRRTAKEVNFGVLYGMGAFGLAQRTGLTRFEAQEFIDNYFETFKGVKKFVEFAIDEATKKGYAETMFGRRRDLTELRSNVNQIKMAGERMAINMPIQGTQADIVKMAMIEIYKMIHGKDDEIRMLLQVHDELVFEIKKGEEKKWVKAIKDIMEGIVKLDVPIVVEVKIGNNWRDMENI